MTKRKKNQTCYFQHIWGKKKKILCCNCKCSVFFLTSAIEHGLDYMYIITVSEIYTYFVEMLHQLLQKNVQMYTTQKLGFVGDK